ncbi:MAG TPA: urease accessory protein UreE, partial [Opitutus sp.]|nr:urease accessory protein UreE [Opitutus sp.]
MLHLIQAAVVNPNPVLPEVAVPVERMQIVKRLWRGAAVDGTEFGFELGAPLGHGDTVFEHSAARYVLSQHPEALLEISLEIAPSAAAGIG